MISRHPNIKQVLQKNYAMYGHQGTFSDGSLHPLDMSRVVGPMVAQSDAPFRVLCLKYGATCVYSEMLFSSRIVNDPHYLDSYLPDCDTDLLHSIDCVARTSFVVQICGCAVFL